MGSESANTSEELDKVTVLVTGFGPFQGYAVNPASITVKALGLLDFPEEVRVICEEVPVEYRTVCNVVPKLWSKYQPKLVVHVGVGCDGFINVEQRAFNSGYITKDTKCNVPCNNSCVTNGEKILQCNLDLVKIVEDVNELEGLPVKFKISDNPGRYLCSYIYYKSLSIDANRSIFLHIPPFKDGVDESAYANSIRSIILVLLQHMEIIS